MRRAAAIGREARPLGGLTLVALAAALAVGVAARPSDVVHLEAGGVAGGFLRGWTESDRTSIDPEVGALDPTATEIGQQFRFRGALPSSQIDLPLAARQGGVRIALRAMARVRTELSFHVDGRPAGAITIPRGPWGRHEVEIPAGGHLRTTLVLRPLPMVRVPDEYMMRPKVWVADIEASSPEGLRFSTRARLLLAAVPLALFAFGLAAGLEPRASLAASLASAAGVIVLAHRAPLPLLLALPRLLGPALAAGLLTRVALGRQPLVAARTRAGLACLVAAGIVLHGSLPFVPGYDPYDVEVHVRRARDLGTVPLQYDALLRYGSHMPTVTQTFGTATAALGEKTLIPYSPLPYVAYYALHGAGLDLHWGMTVLDAALAMAMAPWLWLVACRVWNAGGAWIAALLYTLDLPVWHHLARAHLPASFGSALGTAALLFLAVEADRLERPRRIALAACVLAIAALGYSSLVVLFGLFGLALMAILVIDAGALAPSAKRGLAAALCVGGLLSGVVFYFHYVPGLLHGVGPLQLEPDLFQPRTYFIFHNESRQAMRIWAAGFAIPLVAGLLAAAFALRRALPSARPVLGAWLVTWPLVMFAKEPFLFPRPLRWTKEDQFISPLLALLIGGAAWSLPRPWMRWTAAAVAIGAALWLQLGDFRTHATGLMP